MKFLIFLGCIAMFAAMIGCSDDSTAPRSNKPELSLSCWCDAGVPKGRIENTGGAMNEDGIYRVRFEDASTDSGSFRLDAGEIDTFTVSNMHGLAIVTIDGTTLADTAHNCLQTIIQTVMDTLDIAGLIPSPMGEVDISWCHYAYYIDNFTSDPPIVNLVPVTHGMHFIIVYRNITADFRGETDDFACTDVTGDITIDSIVLEADIVFDIKPDDSVDVVLFGANTTINNLDILIDGVLGFLVGWLINFFQYDFSNGLEAEFSQEFNDTLGPLLEDILIVQ